VSNFELVSDYTPQGDQPTAIKQLTDGLNAGVKEQTLLGVTGSGKTFTMSNLVMNYQRPTPSSRTFSRTTLSITL
jgi:excinuclease ABC subunit B